MIQAAVENKYSFNMQVSVKAMAALGRDRPQQKAAVTQRLLASPFSQLGCSRRRDLVKMADGLLPAAAVNG
jgi:hypothetical protein